MTDHVRSSLGSPHGGTLVDLLVPEQDRDKLTDEARNLPKLTVKERELSDLEMLAVGALSPLTGFQGEDDYRSILQTMHLSNGLAWTIPVTLSVDDEEAKRIGGADAVALTATDGGEPLALLQMSGVFRRDRETEAKTVFGTEDLEHPGVAALVQPANTASTAATLSATVRACAATVSGVVATTSAMARGERPIMIPPEM